MSAASEALLVDAAATLARRVEGAGTLSISGQALVAWALQDVSELAQLARDAAAGDQSGRTHHQIAVLGYTADVRRLEPALAEDLEAGLTWLCGRNPKIAGEPAPFFADSVALLGIALGARALGEHSMRQTIDWLLRFVPEAQRLHGIEAWQSCLLATALRVVGHESQEADPQRCPADVGVALRMRSALPSYSTKEEEDRHSKEVLELLTRETDEDLTISRAALRLASYGWVRRSTPVVVPGRATVADVVTLLEGVPAGLRRWVWEEKAKTRGGEARKWHVDNEYHVQSLIHLLLAPIFVDLKEEEFLSSIGPKQPKADLYIPSMQLIIEVKFVRTQDPFQKVVEEIAADASLYLADLSEDTALVPFVWDDSRRSEQHPLLKTGLGKIHGVVGTVVVSRPGAME